MPSCLNDNSMRPAWPLSLLLQPERHHPKRALGWSAAVITVALANSASGYTPTTNLGSLGLTANQQRTGDAVQTVCGQLAPRTDRNAKEEDLFVNCRKMVQNGFEISPPGPTDNSLGLDQAGLSAVVQTVATEELGATRDMAIEQSASQTSAAITRLQAVRRGVRFGLAAAGAFDAIALSDPRQQAEWGATGGGAGDATTGPWGFFVNAKYGFGDRNGTDAENDFDYDVWGFDIGGDYRFSENLVIGVLGSYGNVDVDFDDTAAVPDSDIEADNWGIGLYGTYYQNNYYVDGLLGYAYTDYDMRRGISPTLTAPDPARTAKSDTDSDTFTASIGGGVDIVRNAWTYGPYGRLTYQHTDIDGYTESGAGGLNLQVSDQSWESLTLVLGGRLSYALSQDWGIVVPQGRLGVVYEFKDDSSRISAIYAADPRKNELIAVTDDPDNIYFEFGVGASAVLRNGLQAFVDYQTLLDHEFIDDHLFTVGLRGEL